jgi:hypothetical protein
MAVTCGFTELRHHAGHEPAGQRGCDVSEGELEPLAYILHSSADTWLDLPTQAVEP